MLDFDLKMILNHDQKNFLEEIEIEGDTWSFRSLLISAGKIFTKKNQVLCLSFKSDSLLSFKGAESTCQSIISHICPNGVCQKTSIDNAPELQIYVNETIFSFSNQEYLYFEQGQNDEIKCRFSERDFHSKCADSDIVIGKVFLSKFTPMFQFMMPRTGSVRLGKSFNSSLAFMIFEESYKPAFILKIILIVIFFIIVVIVLFLLFFVRRKNPSFETYHKIHLDTNE